ncbi:hypothetical protein KAJ27_08635 [bacterium]|nr:hypothetical protein [bacterium]
MTTNMFHELKNNYKWKPIWGCPGRYIFSSGVVKITIQQLTNNINTVYEEIFTGTTDPVLYCFFEGGGLISYRKENGYLHTLCDTDGMNRKIASLKQN